MGRRAQIHKNGVSKSVNKGFIYIQVERVHDPKLKIIASPGCKTKCLSEGKIPLRTERSPVASTTGGIWKIRILVWHIEILLPWLGNESVECWAELSTVSSVGLIILSHSECQCWPKLISVWMSMSDEKNGPVSGVGRAPFHGAYISHYITLKEWWGTPDIIVCLLYIWKTHQAKTMPTRESGQKN